MMPLARHDAPALPVPTWLNRGIPCVPVKKEAPYGGKSSADVLAYMASENYVKI